MKYNLVYVIDGMGMGGAEKLLLQTVLNLNKDQFNPRICILQEKGNTNFKDYLARHDIKYDVLDIQRLRTPNALSRMVSYFKKYKTDIVHTQLLHSDVIGNIAAKFAGIPSLCTIHTLISKEQALKKRLKQRLEWLVHRHCSRKIVTVSEASRLNYLQYNTSCPPSKVVTLHNGIDLTQFPHIDGEGRNCFRDALKIVENRKILVTVAVLRKEKGIQYVLGALPEIIKQVPEVVYLVVGEGSYRKQLETLVAEKNLERNVIFTGERDDIPRILTIADIFLLPSLTEALPTVLAEAMAAGLPVIATDVGGIPEMIIDNRNGTIVSPGNPGQLASASIDLLMNTAKADKMGQAGKEIVHEKFNIALQVSELEDLYREVIQSGGQDEDHCG